MYIYRERGKEPQKPRETTWGQYREKPLGSRSYLCLVTVWSSPPLQYRLNAEHLGFPSSLAARTHYTELDIVTDIRVPGRLCF